MNREEIKFQNDVLDIIDGFSIDNFPHTVLLEASIGSGKHLICRYIADKFEFPLVDITEDITLENINDIYLTPEPKFYIINLDDITVREQNIILKFLEEPSSQIFILLLSSTGVMLDTIRNRCFKLSLKKYTRKELQTFTNDDLLLNIFSTPGQIINAGNVDFRSLYDYAEKVFVHIESANYSNCLVITDRINCTKDAKPELFDSTLFSLVLLYLSSERREYRKFFLKTRELVQTLNVANVNKKHVFDRYLLELKFINEPNKWQTLNS